MSIFSERIKELRQEKNLTQKALAQIIGTTDDSIFSWEKGRSEPDIESLAALCKVFRRSADYLIGIEDETGKKEYEEMELNAKRINKINNINIQINNGGEKA